MLSASPLTSVSAFLSYLVQITFAYLAASLACALIRSPRIRLRAWAALLLFTVARWLMLCSAARAAVPAPLAAFGVHVPNAAGFDWSWPVMESWAPYLATLPVWWTRFYVAILAIALLQLFWTWLRLQSLLCSGESPSPALHALFQSLCRETKVRRCRISLVADLPSPATAGWWHPHVLLPAEVVPQLSPTELTHVLRHELAHVRHRDYLWDLLASFACRVVFFHPAAWLVYRRLRWERELSCDQAVVQDCQEVRLQYAECLAKLARRWYVARTHSPEGIGLAASPSLLATRVRALLCESSHSSICARLSRACLSSVVVLLSLCLLPALGLTLYWSAPLPALSTLSRRASPATRSRSARKSFQAHAHLSSQPESAPAQPEIANLEAVSSILASPNVKPLPVLVISGATEHGPANPKDTPSTTAQGDASAGAWNESPMPLATAPNWQKLATDAAAAGVAALGQGGVGSPGGETQDGQSGQQGNH
jgi:beta-lactamase regulating signal transducer with metallopeptidase domain